jgi:Flp pilus assembly protein TadG
MGGRDERGEITAFLLLIFFALFAIGGLVIDGGLALAAKRRAMNEAQAAARAGANQIDEDSYRRNGSVVIDRGKAEAAARQYLVATHHERGATVDFSPDNTTVNVSVTFTQPMTILGIGNIRSLSISGNGSARNAHGVVSEE